MIYGIGNDIIEIERIKKACENESFLNRCFTPREIELFAGKPQSLAGNFAGKEAGVKGMGTGVRGFMTGSLEILRDELGKPYANVYGDAKKICDKIGISRFHISISHSKDYAAAVAVAEKD